MSKHDYQATMKALNNQQDRMKGSPEVAKQFLIALGVLTKSGKVTDRYKAVCIPQGQD